MRERKNHLIQIRVSKEEKDKIEELADSMGYSSVSDFSRSRLIGNSLLVIQRLNEIKFLLENGKISKEK